MANGLNAMLKRNGNSDGKTGIGSRRIFAPQFKLQVLDSYRNDADCKGNQRATARKYGIHRRQIQKWLQVENNLRNSVIKNKCNSDTVSSSINNSNSNNNTSSNNSIICTVANPEARKCGLELALSHGDRQRDDVITVQTVRHTVHHTVQSQRQAISMAATDGPICLRGNGSGSPVNVATVADKRVPDIPQPVLYNNTNSNTNNNNTTTNDNATIDKTIITLPVTIGSIATSSSEVITTTASSMPVSISSISVPAIVPMSVVVPTTVATVLPLHSSERLEQQQQQPVLIMSSHEWRRGSPPITPSVYSEMHHSPPVSVSVPLDLRRSPDPDPDSDPIAPIDLSLKSRHPHRDDYHVASISPVVPPVPASFPLSLPLSLPLTSPVLLSPHYPDVWDLSTKNTRKRTHEDPVTINNSANVNRPVKLFKPYLDQVIVEQPSSPQSLHDNYTPPPSCTQSPDTKSVIITNLDSGEHYSIYQHHNNNNNNNNNNNIYNNNHFEYQVDYNLCNDYYYNSNSLHLAREPFIFGKASSGCMKQRQSYSLDFKLSAIECYYSDAVCRGNQRAVATKFKIHRRQVQKWLKQEDQLRQRMRPLHIVSR